MEILTSPHYRRLRARELEVSTSEFNLDQSNGATASPVTLVHTAPELVEAANRMLRDMGRPAVSQDLLMSYIGNGISWLVKRALTGDMHAEPDTALYNQALPIFDEHYTELLLQSKPFEGVVRRTRGRFGCGCGHPKSFRSP